MRLRKPSQKHLELVTKRLKEFLRDVKSGKFRVSSIRKTNDKITRTVRNVTISQLMKNEQKTLKSR